MKPLEYWTPEGFEISSYQYSLKDRISKTHKTSGSDNTGLCTYTYNELGFRGDSIHKNGFKVMSLGCSHTEGVGLNNETTSPAQFCSHIPYGVNLNFGTGGRSNDFICRCLMTYYDLIKPDLVLIMYTKQFRREIYTFEGGIEPYMPTSTWGYMEQTEDGKKIQKYLIELQNNNSDFINWYKNHLLIKYFLESKKCNWIWNGSFALSGDYTEYNRFDDNYTIFKDRAADGKHPGPQHNVLYSVSLYRHIYNNFRNYLPTDASSLTRVII